MAASLGKPITLYGPNNQPITPDPAYSFRRSSAKRTGSLKNWIPQRFWDKQSEAQERQFIVERTIDLTNTDPHAAGVVEGFATTIVGSGLIPHPMIDPEANPNLDKDQIRRLQAQQRTAYYSWYPFADAGQRMTFGAIQFLVQRNIMQHGEYLVLLPMLNDPTRPYSLACQVINPLRLKTPIDLVSTNPNIRDGVELGSYGQPAAYWIKRSDPRLGSAITADVSTNFIRIPAKQGHRWNVLHGFISQEPEQVRGMSFFSPAMKFFRDLNDYLDAELVSNIVTAAFSLFIEVAGGSDPLTQALMLANQTETTTKSDGILETRRYQEMVPGLIMYGNVGEKPHPITASRPGQTFEPFTKIIKKAISMGIGIPYPVLFKDVENVNFAGFRSAMLDAWRVFIYRRVWLGQMFCQPIFTMLQEEAFLRGNLEVTDFYGKMQTLTRAEWRGSPKGDIEPIKAVQADILAIQNNLKTRAEAIAERGGAGPRTTFDQLAEEQSMMAERGLTEVPIDPASVIEAEGEIDEMAGAGVEGTGGMA